ncbi:GntR family transcriptional regulator [Streptomyces melanosporofaciens]|uniref:DNA-binding transcriptional regulator, GntR family n=1 Tax=Streptomyces melanosporofaciens TaxID=67327 RepID=A0A1H4IDR7_STRMJ|nr:GntR family transcriptional regulator [Streptomyces melanosporofaciens]SEB31392.1 DNA-binding transcriptional regulator, GntR family [Streptomyces melanosporofaciens]
MAGAKRGRATLATHPVAVPSRPDMIAARLRQALADGEITEGEQLVEPDLVASFGASRPTVREALQRLVQEGLVTAIPHRGVFVTTFSPEDLADIYDARRAIETSAALRLAETQDPAVLASLREHHRAMTTAVTADDPAELTAADMRFHETLVACLRNQRLERTSRTLLVETRMCLTRLEGHYSMPQEAVDEHADIVGAIQSADVTAVIKAVGDHMTNAAELLDRLHAQRTA